MLTPEPFLATVEIFGGLLLIEVLRAAIALQPGQSSAQVANLVDEDFGLGLGHVGLVVDH